MIEKLPPESLWFSFNGNHVPNIKNNTVNETTNTFLYKSWVLVGNSKQRTVKQINKIVLHRETCPDGNEWNNETDWGGGLL